MTSIDLKHIDRFKDRHGTLRYYFRRGKGERIALPGLPGSPEFMEAYKAAHDGIVLPAPKKKRGNPGTLDRLASDYFQSDDFLRMQKQTQTTYRAIIETWISTEKIGHRPAAGLRREHIKKMMGKRAATPGAANQLLKKIKILMRFAISTDVRADDPTAMVKKYAVGEWHTWDEKQIAQYEKHWKIGTVERLAFALLLYTGQRRSDVVKMVWDDIDDNVIHVRQQKTGNKVWIPLHPDLRGLLENTLRESASILTNSWKKTFSAAGFGMWMAKKIDEAGLPDECVTHGLRKAAARRLADAGCSTKEIASITGHKTLSEIERYTKDASQKRLATSAMDKLTENK